MTMITLADDVPCYLSEPSGALRGALVLIHEIWGLADHITDVADRYAAEGYLVAAPDLLSHVGVSPEAGEELHRLVMSTDEKERVAAQPAMRDRLAPARTPEFGAWAVGALRSVVDDLAARPSVGDRIGVTGFCFGGTYTFALAAADQRIRAAVPFYGAPPDLGAMSGIGCPVLAFYGDQDERLMATLPEVRTAMAAAEVDFTAQVYAGARHAFFNDSNDSTYDADAAGDAWRRTLAFLAAHLG